MDRPQLLAERDRLDKQVRALTQDFDAIVESSELVSTDDEHDPDGSTLAYERAKATALLDTAQRDLRALDLAIARAASGTYGRCSSCGDDIGAERLGALPATSLCITCATAR